MIPKSKGINKKMIQIKKKSKCNSENEIEIRRRRRKEQLHIGWQPNNVLAKENSSIKTKSDPKYQSKS